MMCTFLCANVMPTFAAGGQTGSLSGTVVTTAGVPVPGAAVSIAAPSGTYRATTDARGVFQIIGIVVDTYTLSVAKSGYDTAITSGVTIPGDQTLALGNVRLSATIATIGRVTARSTSGAFQPTQGQDSYTFSGEKQTEALGKSFNTNQTALIASAPSAEIDKAGNLTIRGSLATEIGLNFDGINYTQVDHGGPNNVYLNGIGSATINAGAGDATQGSAGAGVVNLIPKRGTNPAFGTLDLEATTPYFNHQLGLEYGFATPDNRFSNYFSFTGNDANPTFGLHSSSLSSALAAQTTYPYFAENYTENRDFVDNFVFKFGKDQNQSLQLLYQTHWDREYYNAGNSQVGYFSGDLHGQQIVGVDSSFYNYFGAIGPLQNGQASGGTPGTATSLGTGYYGLAPNPTVDHNQSLLKLEYDKNFDARTFLALRLYHVNQETSLFDPSGVYSGFGGSSGDQNSLDGGQRLGTILEITHQFGEHNLVTFNGTYELQTPSFAEADAGIYANYAASGFGPVGYEFTQDFVRPANTNAPLTFAPGSANACPVAGGCWLYYLNSTKVFPDGTVNPSYGYFANLPRIPDNLLASPNSKPQYFGLSLRDQITVTSKLHLDLGLRYEGQNYHLPPGSDTGDIGPDYLTNSPKEIEPRAAVSYQLSSSDAVRASFGRTTEFLTLGSEYTPLAFQTYLNEFPNAASSIPGSNGTAALGFNAPTYNLQPGGTGCGSGEAGLNGFPFRACSSYADLIRWEEDVFYPDAGDAKPSTYTNIDGSYSHQFKNGYSVRVSPFYRKGENIIFNGVVASVTDPVTGAVTPLSFRPFFSGFTKATGAEFYATTPESKYGLSGFLSATYTNAFSNRPAGSPGEDTQPTIPLAALLSGNVYRVGYQSPFVSTLGAQFKTKNGFRIAPVIRYDRGYPIGVGTTTPVTINGVSFNVPSTNNSASLPVAPQSSTGAYASQYVDPTNPGSVLKPNIYATRGTAESSSPGGALSHPRFDTDLSLEYKAGRNTFGVQVVNLFNVFYTEPIYNSRYEPITTGVSGYNSGQTTASYSAAYAPYGTANFGPQSFGNSAYVLSPSNQPITFRFYYQLGL